MIRILTVLTALLLAGHVVAQPAPDRIEEVRRQVVDVPPPEPGATHQLNLTLVTFAQGRWDAESIAAATRHAALLLAPCGVQFGRVELRVIEAPRHYRFYFTPVSRRLARLLALPPPVAFFADDTLNQPAFEAEAIGRGNSRARPELAGTVWLAHGVRDAGIALAHELVHVLADSGDHSAEPGNLMREDTAPANIHLTALQCALVTSTGTQQGLLRPLAR